MNRPKCEKCTAESELTVQASGHFCRLCFIDYFRQKFRRILGASKIIRKGDRVALAYDGSKSAAALLDILIVLSRGDDSNPKYHKKNRYESVAVHLGENEKIEKVFERLPIEHHVIAIGESEIEKEEIDRIDRFDDETERVYNRAAKMKKLILRKCKELDIQHVIMASMVDHVAADALTSLCLGLGRHLSQSAVLAQQCDGVTILRPFREVTQVEVDFYCRALSLEHPKKDEEDPNGRKNSVQALSSLFMTNLALVGQKSNPSAIIRMAEKIKAKD